MTVRTASAPATRRRTARSQTAQRDTGRDALLTQHLGLVHHVARQLANRLSTEANLDELISSGMVGLIQAVDAFDRDRGLSFSTFAVPRIRGAILDDLRKQDHVPRNVRRRTRDVTRARDILAARLRRQPSHAEIAAVMQVPTELLRRWDLDAEGAAMQSLDQPVRSEDGSLSFADTLADEHGVDVEETLTRERLVEEMKRAIAGLKEQERTVLALNYFEELKLQEIAQVLGVSVCRISQIRTAALGKLRVALNDLRAA
jgi:RNA polymerase sigma factor FliA